MFVHDISADYFEMKLKQDIDLHCVRNCCVCMSVLHALCIVYLKLFVSFQIITRSLLDSGMC